MDPNGVNGAMDHGLGAALGGFGVIIGLVLLAIAVAALVAPIMIFIIEHRLRRIQSSAARMEGEVKRMAIDLATTRALIQANPSRFRANTAAKDDSPDQ